jgi:hypothetical protein
LPFQRLTDRYVTRGETSPWWSSIESAILEHSVSSTASHAIPGAKLMPANSLFSRDLPFFEPATRKDRARQRLARPYRAPAKCRAGQPQPTLHGLFWEK